MNISNLYIDQFGDVVCCDTHEYCDVSKEMFCQLAGCQDAVKTGWKEMGGQFSPLGQWEAV